MLVEPYALVSENTPTIITPTDITSMTTKKIASNAVNAAVIEIVATTFGLVVELSVVPAPIPFTDETPTEEVVLDASRPESSYILSCLTWKIRCVAYSLKALMNIFISKIWCSYNWNVERNLLRPYKYAYGQILRYHLFE